MSHLGPYWAHLRAFSGHLEAISRPPWDMLGPSWAILGPRCSQEQQCGFCNVFIIVFDFVLGHCGAILGPPWAILGPCRAILKPPWSHIGAILGRLEATSRPSWAFRAPSGASWGHLEPQPLLRCKRMCKTHQSPPRGHHAESPVARGPL